MASRKDNKGRVLKTGESQRANGTYEFRYYDAHKDRHTIYAPTLSELREKEAEVQKMYANGTNYVKGAVTVVELVKRYLEAKDGLSYNTQVCYERVIERLKNSTIGNRQIRDIKTSDAKRWVSNLSKSGLGYWSINQIKGLVSPAFESAVEDEILVRNPFGFPLSKVIATDPKPREALSYKHQKELLQAFKNNSSYAPRYELIAIMLGTGLRIGEATGLTFDDIDMDNRTINVNHQLIYNHKRGLYVVPPKTSSGNRIIPMSDTVYRCFQSAIKNRRIVTDEPVVDGYSGFIFLTKRGTPEYASLVQTALANVIKEHNQTAASPLPRVTPHILRHTFCTNMIDSGVSIKDVQSLMGHSNANVTMNVYAHVMKDKTRDALVETMDNVCRKFA